MNWLVLLLLAPLYLKSQGVSGRDFTLTGKWQFIYRDTTLSSKKKEIKCDVSNTCEIIEFTSDKKYGRSYGAVLQESGTWRFKNDSLIRDDRITEASFPGKYKMGPLTYKVERLLKGQLVFSSYETGKKVKGVPKAYLFYKKLE
ncbi:MAG: hypothetical protein K0S33_52 [Bacteroidetes bacterium]|jgi:hypothetical protein|nr:hypothetical protein [Bacteroidota bacterium]